MESERGKFFPSNGTPLWTEGEGNIEDPRDGEFSLIFEEKGFSKVKRGDTLRRREEGSMT